MTDGGGREGTLDWDNPQVSVLSKHENSGTIDSLPFCTVSTYKTIMVGDYSSASGSKTFVRDRTPNLSFGVPRDVSDPTAARDPTSEDVSGMATLPSRKWNRGVSDRFDVTLVFANPRKEVVCYYRLPPLPRVPWGRCGLGSSPRIRRLGSFLCSHR